MSKMNLMRLVLACSAVILAACQSPTNEGGGFVGGSGHSVYGDRPGPQGFHTVLIDPGHGGKDSGARGRIPGMPEKVVALDIAKCLQSELSSFFNVRLTRSSDVFIPLDGRVAMANKTNDAILVSIHLNDGPRRLSGAETYWWRTDSYSLAKRVNASVRTVVTGSNNRGFVRRRLRLTRNPEIPGILVECGYVSNPREAGLLSSAGYRARIAHAIATAIRQQAALGDSGVGPLPKPLFAPPSKATDARS
ncbi:MAG: N-acetylmuramoyl-L-alanine amidase [Verrucomicrobiaceae bacterium]|nr:N-acetylmuramoyl-L-alanine amidase [Verrucomicrobiaceae bacterium]